MDDLDFNMMDKEDFENIPWHKSANEYKEEGKVDQVWFRYLLKKKEISIAELARQIERSYNTVNYKILHSQWTIREIRIVCNLLEMTFEEVFR